MQRNLLQAVAFSVAPAVTNPGGRKQTLQVPGHKGYLLEWRRLL